MTNGTRWAWWEILLTVILLPLTLFGAMVVLGMIIDTAAQNSERHDQCLRGATNGYEIKQCR